MRTGGRWERNHNAVKSLVDQRHNPWLTSTLHSQREESGHIWLRLASSHGFYRIITTSLTFSKSQMHLRSWLPAAGKNCLPLPLKSGRTPLKQENLLGSWSSAPGSILSCQVVWGSELLQFSIVKTKSRG